MLRPKPGGVKKMMAYDGERDEFPFAGRCYRQS